LRAGARLGPRGVVELARLGLPSVRRLATAHFRGAGGPLLLTGNALHADFTPDSPGSALFGLLLTALGQQHGFPVPEGGAGRLTDALVARLAARGGRVLCSTAVTSIEVRGRHAVAVRTEHGDEIGVGRAVLADVGAPALYGSLVRHEHLPARVLEGIRGFAYDHA